MFAAKGLQLHDPAAYNVVWTSQSRHSGESMPVGGHDIGLNVWVEDGELLFYIDRSGSFDENNQMLKLGRVRLRLEPDPFAEGARFSQELKLEQGCIEIAGANGGLETRIRLWVDVERPVVHLEVDSDRPTTARLQYESWRLTEREVPYDRRMSATSTVGYPGKVVTLPDQVQFDGDQVLFWHRNGDDLVFDRVVEQQGLREYREQLWNPQRDFQFGGLLRGQGMVASGTAEGVYIETPFRAWVLSSVEPAECHRAEVVLHAAQCADVDDWRAGLQQTAEAAGHDDERSRAWWRDFWQRSWIVIDPRRRLPDAAPWRIGRNYALFRYMLGCNAFGEYPTKFNGGLFTSDPCFVLDDSWRNESADFRRWGGGSFTAQNQRLVYWPMLKSGDWDMLRPQFEFYRRALGNAELRTQVYWGHGGCSFTEQLENFGLPIGWGWGWPDSPDPVHRRTPFHDRTENVAPWIKYLYVNQLEFSYMILKFHQYSGADIGAYVPLITSALRFFDEHYRLMYSREALRELDEDGKLVVFPSTACETYKLATNPADVVAALDATTRALLELDQRYLEPEARSYFEALLERVPPLPFRQRDGKLTIAPAATWNGIINVEIPQLYPVFPYEQYGIGRPDLQVAIDTWLYGTDIPEQKNHISWHQDNIFCARLGLAEQAAAITALKLDDGDFRFPAFWGPGHDWLPDHNWGGSGMIGLQDMLLQSAGDTIYLLPAWPREWDVDFRVHAPRETVVQGKVRDGALIELDVRPPQRRADVVNCWEDDVTEAMNDER